MSNYAYIATSQKATAVNFSLVCNFTSNQDKNLIIVKSNHIEIYTLKDDLLIAELDAPFFATIRSIECFRPISSQTDHIFILTNHHSFCSLSYDINNKKLILKTSGNLKDRGTRCLENGSKTHIDPDYRMIGCLLSEGYLKILPIDIHSGLMKDAFNIAFNETKVIDVKFLYNCSKPTICLLYQDNHQSRHVKTLSIEVREKEFNNGPWSQNNVEFGANLLIPVPSPLGGVLVVGTSSITYMGGISGTPQAVEISPTLILSYCCISTDGTRFLIADHRGNLSVIVLLIESNTSTTATSIVTGIIIDTLGITSIAENISYLNHGLVYIGSMFGDSQLIRLHPYKNNDTGSNIEVLNTYNNIGPIVDMVLVDNDKHGGQRQLVTCSGAYKDGSLRIVRSGIGIQEQASLEVAGIKGVWSLRASDSSEFDKYIVQSFIGETRVLAIENEEMAEIEIIGLSSQEQTFYCGNMAGDVIVQVTPHSVRIIDCQSFALLSQYTMESTITVASCNRFQVILAISGGELVYLELNITTKQIERKHLIVLDQDIACLSMKHALSVNNNAEKSNLISIGMWTDNTVRLLVLPTLQEICRTQLNTETQARDVVIADLDGKLYLLVGLGDGHIITYTIDSTNSSSSSNNTSISNTNEELLLPSLTNKRSGVLGTHPVTFTCFKNNNKTCVFAACDRPTIIYSKNNKILFSVLDSNQSEFTSMAPFHCELFPDCLALCSESCLLIGTIDAVQKVHIQTIPLKQSPRRIIHSSMNGIYAVITEQTIRTEIGEESLNKILFFDDGTMEQFQSFGLDRLEQGLSCHVHSFHNNNSNNATTTTTTTTMNQDTSNEINVSTNNTNSNSTNTTTTTTNSTGQLVEYIIVGTAYITPNEIEPTHGRILIFEIDMINKRVQLIAEKETKAAVFTITSISGYIAVGLGSKVSIFNLKNKDDIANMIGPPEILHQCTYSGHIMTLFLKSKGDIILVGDLVRSMTVLRYNHITNTIEEIARDFNSNYMRAIEIMDGTIEDYYFGSDIHGNIFSMRTQSDAITDEERGKLDSCGEFNCGDNINTIRRGTLVGQPIDSTDTSNTSNSIKLNSSDRSNHTNTSGMSVLHPNYLSITGLAISTCTLLFAGVSGAIGTIISINDDSYAFFHAIEKAMRQIIISNGGFNHREWRNFKNDLRTLPQRNIIDGDLVELCIDLNLEQLEILTDQVNNEMNIIESAKDTTNKSTSTSSNNAMDISGNMILELNTKSIKLTSDDIIRRIEDIARLH